jgi:hypothetical protein
MLSILRKGLVYKNISSDIVEHDLDIDADQWSYDSRDVYRGTIDSTYLEYNINVYWLYDGDSKRIGLAEHDINEPSCFNALWFYNNPFATLLQDELWKPTGKTLWSKLSNEAYQDCLELDFRYVSDQALSGGVLLVTPEILMLKPNLYTCEKCNKKSLTKSNVCSTASVSDLDFSQFSILFLDDDFVLYEKTTSHQQQHDASVQEQPEQPEQLPPDLQECQQPVHPQMEQLPPR